VRVAVAVVALVASGCTFEPGTGFATLEDASLSAKLEPGSRDLGNRTLLSDQGEHVHLAVARLALGSVVLAELRGGGGESVSFDPASPPPGYSLCHAGHCHADDGRLVSYEAIQSELAGDGASLEAVATLPVEADADLWDGGPRSLERVLPSRELPRARLTRLSVEVEELELSGDVAAGAGAPPTPFSVVVPVSAGFEKAIDLPIDREEPGEFSLRIAIAPSGRLVDGVDWNAIASAGSITDPEAPEAIALVESLLASDVRFETD
jgi:hypothetical protein